MRPLSAAPSPYARKVAHPPGREGHPVRDGRRIALEQGRAGAGLQSARQDPVLILDDDTTVYESRFILE